MRKKPIKHLVLLATVATIIMTLPTAVLQAQDLPIDITAITRQETSDRQLTTRISSHLFTEEAQRVNHAQAEQIRQRQATTQYLFTAVAPTQETTPHQQISAAASSSALFTQPSSINRQAPPPQAASTIPIWLVAPIIALCAIGGFIWALISNAKKKNQSER